MILPLEVREKLKSERGVYVSGACDACRALLGAVRYARRGEPGEWCSQKCRDGVEQIAFREGRRSRSGRPRQHATNAARQRAYRTRKLVAV